MKYWFASSALFFCAILLLSHEIVRLPDDTLRMTLLDVGQGDAILITTPGNQRILIDGGPDLSALERLGEELPFLNRTIDLLILSHTDADHITALPEVLQRYDVQKVLMTGTDASSSRYRAFVAALEGLGTQVLIADSKNDIDLGEGAMLDILWPESSLLGHESKQPNNASIVAKLIWNDHEILLTGDIEEKIEEELLKNGTDLRADILKVPHHGSKTSSSTGFLLAVDPELAVISVGKENRFGHPHVQVVERYHALGIPVQRTDEERISLAFR